MSDKLAMHDVTRASIIIRVRAELRAKIERMARAVGLSIGDFCGNALDAATSREPFTTADLERAHEIIAANIEKRDSAKIKKGVK